MQHGRSRHFLTSLLFTLAALCLIVSCDDAPGGTIKDGSTGDSGDSTNADGNDDVPVDLGDGVNDVAPAVCLRCHGDSTSPAPPLDANGNAATTATGVGAHRSHVGASGWHVQVPCLSCHLVPVQVSDPGHVDTPLPAELTWGGISNASGAQPVWNGMSCASTYCHGTTLIPGGRLTMPSWTLVDGSQAACGTCHGLPPNAPHPASVQCERCHPDASSGLGFVNPDAHIDGIVDVNLGCTSCHGGVDGPAPPVDTQGNSATTATGVGAHQRHLGASDWHAEVSCSDCHVVPTDIAAVGHMDTALPAELTWGGLAGIDSASPAWNGASCTSIYCHGATLLPGGANIEPTWTTVDGSQAACGTCHGLPPQGGHPASTACEGCHPTIDASRAFPDPSRHIDGVVDVSSGCQGCHGDATSAAPPVDTTGNSATSFVGVGAHRSHLGASVWHSEVQCDDCHLVPADVADVGHMDSALPAELTWGTLPQADSAIPSWNSTSCSGIYCHGATLMPGGSNVQPTWTTVDGTQADCGTCHGLPPAGTHATQANCSACHTNVEAGNASFVDPTRHIDGVVDVTIDCSSCHGNAFNAAPPTDTLGRSATTDRGVGAHQEHLGTSTWHKEVTCNQCHIVPASIAAVGHTDTALPAELTWGSLPRTDGANPSFNGATCSSVYCHGPTLLPGGSNTTPVWTSVNGTQATCGSCHGIPPGGTHTTQSDCSSCHPNIDASLQFPNPDTHIDGVVNVAGGCTGCHGDPANNAAPPVDVGGNSSTSARGVGAHQSHLQGNAWHGPVACTECHDVPSAVGDAGHIDTGLPAELTWGPTAGANGSAPSWDGTTCSGTYCHGETLAGGTNTTPIWTTVNGTQAACGTCHGLPPGGSHPSNTNCASCHPNINSDNVTFSDPGQHINGTVELTGSISCTSCHGSGGNPAPPVDLSGNALTTLRTVGAHRAHLGTSTWHVEFACADCHIVPATIGAAGHTDTAAPAEVTFGSAANQDGGNPAWNGTTCTGVYCHGETLALPGGSNSQPTWTSGSTQAACGTCHGAPPGGTHPNDTNCGSCHPDAGVMTITDAAQHIDGTVQVTLSCTSCHGSGSDPAPPVDTTGNNATSARGVGAHQAHLGSQGTWHVEVTCTQCHVYPLSPADGHNDGIPAEMTWGSMATDSGTTSPSFNGTTCSGTYCHGDSLALPGGSNTTPSWTGGGTQAACGTCHGTPPGGSHPANNDCQNCHPDAQNVGGVLSITDGALHIDGTVQASGESGGGVACASCHAAIFDRMAGNTNTDLSGRAIGSRHRISSVLGVGDSSNQNNPAATWAQPLSSVAQANRSCTNMCHNDHPHTKNALTTHENNLYQDSRTSAPRSTANATMANDFDATLPTGGVCASCHQYSVTIGTEVHPAVAAAAYDVSGHDYESGTYGLHDSSNVARNCTKCHSDSDDTFLTDNSTPFGAVHFSQYNSLLRESPTHSNNAASFLCYECHGTTQPAAPNAGGDVQAVLEKTYSHDASGDAGHNTIAEATPTYNSTYAGANRHVGCLDCHNPHESGATVHTPGTNAIAAGGSPLSGVSGVGFTPPTGNWVATTTTNFTPKARSAYEYEVCFKCHSSYGFGTTPPSASNPRGAWDTWTDVAQEFSPNNRSAHPVVATANASASSALVAAQLTAPWNANPGNQTMYCSDCHGDNAAAPAVAGPHGSGVNFVLTGARTGWPNTAAGQLISLDSAAEQAELFCMNCHPDPDGTNEAHTRGDHSNRDCVDCHILIPHGGGLDRLIGDANGTMPSRYNYQNNLIITGFTKNADYRNYGRGACGSNQAGCSGDHPATNGTDW